MRRYANRSDAGRELAAALGRGRDLGNAIVLGLPRGGVPVAYEIAQALSLPLGGALGTVAVITKQEILLVIVGGLFVVEALSVILQVGFFKMTKGRRIFRMAPLHHHFELKGWAEPKVIVRFWIIAIAMALIAMSTLKLR